MGREIRIMKTHGEVRLGGMPLPKEGGCAFRDDVLIGGNGSVRKEEFIQRIEGRCAI